ncbi:MAG: DUF2264 domain-containing protein [Clostridia bacterium]
MRKKYNLVTKNDTAKAMLDLIRPLKPFYSEGHAWLKVAEIGAIYAEKTALMEGFARVLWGLGPLWANLEDLSEEVQAEALDWLEWYKIGIVNGSNPEHEEYWGDSFDVDQKIVEMAPIATAIAMSPDKLWEPLTQEQKDNVYKYLDQANYQVMHPTNWRYFRILINMTFRILGLPYSEYRAEDDKDLIESCYKKDGWYFDGFEDQVDYYIPFAMHFYGLVYAKLMEKIEPEYSKTLIDRSKTFARDFVYWFGNDGNEIPFGRSLTYRFAHCSFFGALAFADAEGEDGVTYGVMKNLTLRHLENWLERPICDNSGVLTVGYGYPNLFMSERYNAGGSPYWALKGFWSLALPADHAFWTAKEEKYDYAPKKELKDGFMILTHDENEHTLCYMAGQHCFKKMGHCPEKYEKFVYSNQFAFSVSRDTDLVTGAFDSTLAISPAGKDEYKMRYGMDSYETTENSTKINYPMPNGVKVKSVIIPCADSWHVRVHKITTDIEIDIADGGFTIESEPRFQAVSGRGNGKYTQENVAKTKDSAFISLPWGMVGITTKTGGTPIVTDCTPNTNLLYNTSVIAMSTKTVPAGEHIIVTCVFGDRSEKASEKAKCEPQVTVDGDVITVVTNGETIVEEFCKIDKIIVNSVRPKVDLSINKPDMEYLK